MAPMFADASCVLKHNQRCEACRFIMLEFYSATIGEYQIQQDGNIVGIYGEMDPNRFYKAMMKTGNHVSVLKSIVKSPNWNPYGSTSLGYHQSPAMDYYGQYNPYSVGMGGATGMYGGAGGHYSAMHGGHGFHTRRGPPMGAGFGGVGYPPQGYGAMHGGAAFAGAGYPPQGYGGMHGGCSGHHM